MGPFVRALASRFAEASRRAAHLEATLRHESLVRHALHEVAAARAPVALDALARAIGAELEELRAAVLLSGVLVIERASDADATVSLEAWRTARSDAPR